MKPKYTFFMLVCSDDWGDVQVYIASNSFFSNECFSTAKGSCHIVFRSPFRYAIKNKGDNVNGTKYNNAG